VIFNGNSASTATTMTTHMLQFQPETHVLYSVGVWGFGGKDWGPEIGNCRLGSCGCFMIYCLDTACVVLPLFPQPPQPPPFI